MEPYATTLTSVWIVLVINVKTGQEASSVHAETGLELIQQHIRSARVGTAFIVAYVCLKIKSISINLLVNIFLCHHQSKIRIPIFFRSTSSDNVCHLKKSSLAVYQIILSRYRWVHWKYTHMFRSRYMHWLYWSV